MKGRHISEYGKYLTLGAHIAASMLVPVLIGIYLDKTFDISPLGIIAGALLGFGGLISIVLKLAAEETARKKQKKTEKYGK
ncbi:AtpZ/AtpI family protein [Balneolaceae bacterium ANBcel3]|nr:AtpZ/AtpI family protein [Balneolaceae bacterium ANBcel3]